MGTEAVWVPLALSALSAGAQAYNQHDVARRQKEEATNLMTSQQRKQQDVNSTLDQELAKLKQSGPDAAREASVQGFLQQLRANSGNARGSSPVKGSDRFNADTASSSADIQNYGANRADVMSRIIAPTEQRRIEAQGIGRTQDTINGISRDAEAQRFLSALRMNSIQANPWIAAGGQVAGGMAGAMNGSPVTESDILLAKKGAGGMMPVPNIPKQNLGATVWGQ